MDSWIIRSVKRTERFDGTLVDAIERAAAIDDEYQPAFGVDVENADGDTVWTTEDGFSDILAD